MRVFTMILFFLLAPVCAKQTIIINDISWLPYFFINDKNSLQGIGKDLLNICVKKAGYDIEYHRLPVKRTHIYMQTGDIDVTVYSYRKKRLEYLYYAKESLFSADLGFVVKAGSNIKINKLADLSDYKMGHLAGLSYTPELLAIIKEKEKNHQLVTSYNLASMFSQLLAPTPRFEIMANTKTTFYWQAKVLGVSDKIKVLDYTIKKKDYFVTVSKKSKNIKNPQLFLANFDQCLQKLKSNGKYQAILAKYGVSL